MRQGLITETRRTRLLQLPGQGTAEEMVKQDWLSGEATDGADLRAGTYDVKGEGSQ